MTRKTVRSILELGDFFKSGDGGANYETWGPFNRIFRVSTQSSRMTIPKKFEEKLTRWFKLPGDINDDQSIKRAEYQTVVRVFDCWTCNQTCFNGARALRPLNNGETNPVTSESAEMPFGSKVPECDFCTPLDYTAADQWGRLENASGLTASNVAKYDGLHSMVVFKEHPPSLMNKKKLCDILDLCTQWFEVTHKNNPLAIYPIMNWNCRARAGASQHHGHSHMLLAENFHYGQWERLKQAAKHYSTENPGCNYFDDLVTAHRNLGLAKMFGEACVFAHIVPFCGYEFKVISWDFDDNFKQAISEAVEALINKFGAECFNLCVHFPPLEKGKLRKVAAAEEVKNKSLEMGEIAMPFMAHLVDRGGVRNSSSDVCGMRIYGSAIVNEDPFSIAQQLGWSM
ncbi:uncharacterized protein [Pocillopora verrucosa]|uniref:uncharacterized protein n=1 Tax=Pocillopora verrucosa TaxID=203993 RepID=UPI003342A3F9